MPFIPALGKGGSAWSTVSSRAAKATGRNPVSKQTNRVGDKRDSRRFYMLWIEYRDEAKSTARNPEVQRRGNLLTQKLGNRFPPGRKVADRKGGNGNVAFRRGYTDLPAKFQSADSGARGLSVFTVV